MTIMNKAVKEGCKNAGDAVAERSTKSMDFAGKNPNVSEGASISR